MEVDPRSSPTRPRFGYVAARRGRVARGVAVGQWLSATLLWVGILILKLVVHGVRRSAAPSQDRLLGLKFLVARHRLNMDRRGPRGRRAQRLPDAADSFDGFLDVAHSLADEGVVDVDVH